MARRQINPVDAEVETGALPPIQTASPLPLAPQSSDAKLLLSPFSAPDVPAAISPSTGRRDPCRNNGRGRSQTVHSQSQMARYQRATDELG